MAEPILTKFRVMYPWVEGVQMCSYEGDGHQGATQGGKTETIILVNNKCQSFDISIGSRSLLNIQLLTDVTKRHPVFFLYLVGPSVIYQNVDNSMVHS